MSWVAPHPYRKIWSLAWSFAVGIVLAGGQRALAQNSPGADDLTVKSVRQRISDEAIEADKKVFHQLRTRLASAKSQGVSDQVCALAKAEAWLNLAEEEYDENEEGEIVEVTLRESQRLLRSLGQGADVLQSKIPLFRTATIARPDLWNQLKQLSERGASCACRVLAQLEVQLSWADHEAEEGLPHARPSIEVAERLAESASREAEQTCPLSAPSQALPPLAQNLPLSPVEMVAPFEMAPAPPPSPEPPLDSEPAAAPAPTAPSEPTIITVATLPWSVHFSTNRSAISPSTAKVLDKVSVVLLRYPSVLIRLEGHADQRGDVSYNRQLSERRTKAVKDYLVKAGIHADHMSTTALGNSRPLTSSRQNRDLAKNRRVVIVVVNIEQIRPEEQESDLHLDQRKRMKNPRPVERSAKPRAPGTQG